MSCGECAAICEAFYDGIQECFNGNILSTEQIIENGRILTWGVDHTCGEISKKEIKLFDEWMQKDWIPRYTK